MITISHGNRTDLIVGFNVTQNKELYQLWITKPYSLGSSKIHETKDVKEITEIQSAINKAIEYDERLFIF